MKLFATKFEVGDETYDGPYIYAENFEEAEKEALIYGVVVTAIMPAVFVHDENDEWNRVLH
tara:strand:+ start:1214 stop:1396 length:183 start_codon:yes stop_codon:yes gene_type:complete